MTLTHHVFFTLCMNTTYLKHDSLAQFITFSQTQDTVKEIKTLHDTNN